MQPLRPGARIAVIAPASAPPDPARLDAGIRYLTARGYEVVTSRDHGTPYGYLSAPDEERLAELNGFLRRADVQALFCVRGGYGTPRLLPDLDYEAARRHPKLLVGYSDITALQLALFTKAGWRSLSGPMVAVEWPEPDLPSERLFWELAQGGTPSPLLGPGGEALQPMRLGTATGTLLGGNLALVARLVGTPYLPDLTGAILFLEDIGEVPYRIDGLLAQLKLAGILDRLGGLVLGAFTESAPPADRPSLSLDDVFTHYTCDLDCPVASGLVYGHFPIKNTLPVGVQARLTVTQDAARLDILEPVTTSA